MIQTLPPRHDLREDRRLLDRDDALADVLRYTVGGAGLVAESEQAIRKAIYAQIDPILRLADAATLARADLETVDRALDTHCHSCVDCVSGQPCHRNRLLQHRFKRLQDRADRAFRALVEGKRR